MTFKTTLLAAMCAADTVFLNDREMDESSIYEAGSKTYCRFSYDDTDWYLLADQEVEVNEFGEAYAVACSTPEDEADPESVALSFKVQAPLRQGDLRPEDAGSEAA